MTTEVQLREGPMHRHFEGDSAWYIHPVTEERFLSVTSALDFTDKAGLNYYWRPGLAAKAALDELPRLIKASRTRPCGRTYSRCRSDSNPDKHDWRVRCTECPCDECSTCVTVRLQNTHFSESRIATDRGKAVHKAVAWWTLHGEMPEVAPDIQPYTRSFLRFVKHMGLSPESWEMSEATVLNRTDRWGGTLDGRVRFDATASEESLKLCRKYGLARPLLSIDVKTREREDGAFYSDMAQQLAAYRRGEVILLDDGTEEKLGPDDGALVIQVHLDDVKVRPVRTRDEEYRSFLNVLGYAYWAIEHGAASIAVRSFPDLDIPGLGKPPAKRAAAKKAMPTKTATGRPIEDVPLPEPTRNSAILRLLRDTTPTLPDDGIPF